MPEFISFPPYDRYGISTFVLHAGLVHISHFGATSDGEGKPLDDIETQATATFFRLQAELRKIGLDLSDVLKITVMLRDIEDFKTMHSVWQRFFPAPAPARTTITTRFVSQQCRIQIDGLAAMRTHATAP